MAVSLQPYRPGIDGPWGREEAAHLLERAGFGGTPAEIRALVELVEHTVVPSDDRIVPVFRRLDELVREVPVVRVSVGTPEAALALLDGLGTSWRT